MSKKSNNKKSPGHNSVNSANSSDLYQDDINYIPNSFHYMEYPVDLPMRANMDDIAVYSDDELFGKVSRFENERMRILEARLDPSPWEIEIAYLRREMGIRKIRREKHEVFLKENAHLLENDDYFEGEVEFNNSAVAV